jgi:succinate-semialdehyde dehydrogenase/glutarate-semialdehyde dehydrogenase
MQATYPELHLYIDGEWLSAQGRPHEAVLNPSTGLALGDLPHATAADLDNALSSADRAWQTWRFTTAAYRSALLRQAATLLRSRVDSLCEALALEQGKTLPEARQEVLGSAEVFEWCADEARRLYGRVIPSRDPQWRQLVLRQPVGVVAAFTPWNFPMMIPARKIAASLAAGCCCIIKPAEETPAGVLELARVLHDAGLPRGVLNVVFGLPARVSRHLIESPLVRKVTFTGSVPVGRLIASLAAEQAKPATLELGGHAPVLIFDDVDVDRTARACATGKFRNAGQVCTSPTRFYVQRASYAAFVESFARAASELAVGDAVAGGSAMGPLASERRVAAMQSLVDDATSLGARVACGGKRLPRDGFFFEPTVLHELPAHARVLSEEPFGPLAVVLPFEDEDEAIEAANALPYGLAAYAFTNDAGRIVRLSERVETGMLGINTLILAGADSPFGGVKDSGYGSEGGMEGVAAYLVTKYVAQAPAP